MSKPGFLAEPVLVGKEKELEELQSFLNSAVEGKGKTVFVSGEAGSGKTRLAREFLNSAIKHGVAVMAGWCLSDSQVPYFPFMEAFNNYYTAQAEEEAAQTSLLQPQAKLCLGMPARVGTERGGMGITSWLAGSKPAGKAEALSPQAWKDQVFVAVSETLHDIAVQSPVILFIDDVHWADSASLALLHYVARAVNNSEQMLVIATYRSEELTADAEGRPHPLAETLRLMQREELFSEVKMANLNLTEVSEIAEHMVEGALEPELAEKLMAESRGNPLFVVESLRMLHERGCLAEENGQWHLTSEEIEIPSKIKNIILRRLACLKYAQRRVLDAASVIGEEFDVELLSTVLGIDYLEILETLNAIAHSTSLVSVEGSHYRFDHARSRETLYEELALPLKRGYHNKIAEKLESVGDEPLRLSDIAYHYVLASNKEKAVKYALVAGKDELAKFSNTQAIKHFQYVLQNIAEENYEERRAALEGLGDAYAVSSMFGEAIKTFDLLAASETGALRLHAYRKASDAAYEKGDMPDLLINYAKKAEELGLDDHLEMARIIDNRGRAWGWGGRGTPKQDLDDYDAALEVFEEENSLVDVAEALCRSGTLCALFFDETRERGLSELIRSSALFKEFGDVRKEIQSTHWKAQGLQYNGFFVDAKREFDKVLRKGEKLGIFSEMFQACLNLSQIASLEGRIEEELDYALKGFEYINKTDSKITQGVAVLLIAAIYSIKGNIEKADEYFAKSAELIPPEFTSNFRILRYLGTYYGAKGQRDKSEAYFKKHLELTGDRLFPQILITKDYAWALEKQGLFEEACVQKQKFQELLDALNALVEKRFECSNLHLSVILPRKIQVGADVEMRLDLVNVGRKPGLLVKIEGIAFPEFKFIDLPSFCRTQGGSVIVKGKSVGPFEIETFKLKFAVAKASSYVLAPEVFYLDDLGNTKAFRSDPITVTVEPARLAFEVLPGRVPTGTVELDKLLYGGIPEGYAVALVSPSFEERLKLIRNYVEAGAENDQVSFFLTADSASAQSLVENFPSSAVAFMCSPRTDLMKNLPNMFKLNGVENLTEIDISFEKAFRRINSSQKGIRRPCVEIVSDVLLQHHVLTPRKWLSGLISTLKSKGFTTMVVIDPLISPEDVPAISSIFDGEIKITEKDNEAGTRKTLKILKLQGQKYLKDEIIL